MSTNCFIGVLDDKTNKVKYIYNHWDGYIAHVGNILYLAYRDVEKVKALISLGDISSLGYNIDAPRKFKDYMDASNLSVAMDCHFKTSFTISYRRDRHEKDVSAKTTTLEKFKNSSIQYVYLYKLKERKWYVLTDSIKHKMGDFCDLGEIIHNQKFYDSIGEKYDSWKEIHEVYEDYKKDLEGGEGRTILDQFNLRLKESKLPVAHTFEFGYTIDKNTGKRLYALYKKPEPGKKNRKLYASNAIIGDLFILLKDQFGVFVY